MLFYDTSHLRNDQLYLKLAHVCIAQPQIQSLPTYYFEICLTDGTAVGYCNLRVGHNAKTRFCGNIGYTIFEQFRGNRYAVKACQLLFELAKMHQMQYLLITCEPNNTPSVRTCQILGGKLLEVANIPTDSEMLAEGIKQVNIYQFDLQ